MPNNITQIKPYQSKILRSIRALGLQGSRCLSEGKKNLQNQPNKIEKAKLKKWKTERAIRLIEIESIINQIVDSIESFINEELWIEIEGIEYRFAFTSFHQNYPFASWKTFLPNEEEEEEEEKKFKWKAPKLWQKWRNFAAKMVMASDGDT